MYVWVNRRWTEGLTTSTKHRHNEISQRPPLTLVCNGLNDSKTTKLDASFYILLLCVHKLAPKIQLNKSSEEGFYIIINIFVSIFRVNASVTYCSVAAGASLSYILKWTCGPVSHWAPSQWPTSENLLTPPTSPHLYSWLCMCANVCVCVLVHQLYVSLCACVLYTAFLLKPAFTT